MRLPCIPVRVFWPASILAFASSEVIACSGPGAAETIRHSGIIGLSFGSLSLAMIIAGCSLLNRRSQGRRIPIPVAMTLLQPVFWMGTRSGDCGFGLRIWSLVIAVFTSVVVALVVMWPRSVKDKWRWLLSGGLAGTSVGILIVAVFVQASFAFSIEVDLLAISLVSSVIIMGCLFGGWLHQFRTNPNSAFKISMRTLLILSTVFAPGLIALLPVIPYEYSVSESRPFSFHIVDGETGQPIQGASLRLIDPGFPLNDKENQGPLVVTGPDGSVEYAIFAQQHGREGLLFRTETTTYNPWLIRAEAESYKLFYTALASDPQISVDQLTASPLGMTFPPPRSVTIRLIPAKLR